MTLYLDTSALLKLYTEEPGVQAAELASLFALRGYDAVQLAAGNAIRAEVKEPPLFVAFDRRLNRAARLLGMARPEQAPL